MAWKLTEAYVQIGADDTKLNRDLDAVYDRMSSKLTGWGVKLSALGASILGGAGFLAKLGMDAVESDNLFEVSFGNMAETARAWSEEVQDALGINAIEARKTSATFDVMLKSMGLNEDAAYQMSTQLTLLAYDMASFYNLRPEEAFEKLRAGIVGESEPLKALGIIVQENTLKQYGYSQSMSEAEKIAIRYAAIMDQTAAAQGDLARTMDSPTNKVRILGQQLEYLGVQVGSSLLGLVSDLSGSFGGIVTSITGWVEANPDLAASITIGVVAFGALAAALGPILLAAGQIVTLWPALTAGFAAAAPVIGAVASPWGLLAVGVATAAVSFIDWGEAWDSIKGGVADAGNQILDASGLLSDAQVEQAKSLDEMGGKWEGLKERAAAATGGILDELVRLTGGYDENNTQTAELLDQAGMHWDAFKVRLKQIWDNILEGFKWFGDATKPIWGPIWDKIKTDMSEKFKRGVDLVVGSLRLLNGDWEEVWNNLKQVVKTAIDAIERQMDRLKNMLPMAGSGSLADRILLLPSQAMGGLFGNSGGGVANAAPSGGGGSGGTVVQVNVSGTAGESPEAFAKRVADAVRQSARMGTLAPGAVF